MRRIRMILAVPLLSMALLAGFQTPAESRVGVSFNINLGVPVVVAEPPDLVMIPGMSVYFVPGGDVDVFFYGGYWWEPVGSRWYRARSLGERWVAVPPRAVPGPLFRVPGDYRVRYGRASRIPYGQWKKSHGGHWSEGRRHGGEDRHGEGRGHGHGRGGD